MLYSIKNIEELEKLNELVSLQNQLKVDRLQGMLGKQNFHEDMKKYLNLSLNQIKMSLKR